ncbi:DUF418 domain-containing protein [Brevibacillus ruminantium]|uniref:DUF418 domain-containing protein n=1 Tax=Brevibacillus ruminantium TaxID=2950604 RepID=A0ABY4WUF4_9BACL|nr:DUF418 domain-containing protein [Brevibacillus ruminantium]USG68216.1 DUF418 domain-containing protein [Brevibacillus ruminantium]
MHSTPTPLEDRINELDIIRGFALFGIFLVNMPGYMFPELFSSLQRFPEHTGSVDFWLRMFLDMFAQTKFYAIFSFLFGIGFYLFMSRLEIRGEPVTGKYLRRLAGLFLFGVLHLFFWFGDILHTYAVAGMLLLFFYRRREAVIRRWAITILVLFQIPMGLSLWFPVDEQALQTEKEAQLARQAVEVYQNGGFDEWLAFRWNYELPVLLENEWMALFTVLPLFLFGLYAGKKGLFHQLDLKLPVIRRYWMISMLIGLPLVALIPLAYFGKVPFSGTRDIVHLVLVQWSGLALFVFYITSILLMTRREDLKKKLSFFAPVGRMALTNYMAQTLVCVSLVRVFDLYGQTPLWVGFVLCLLILPLQAAGSRWWLTRYHYGPLEWVWRCLTYGAVQSWKKCEAVNRRIL